MPVFQLHPEHGIAQCFLNDAVLLDQRLFGHTIFGAAKIRTSGQIMKKSWVKIRFLWKNYPFRPPKQAKLAIFLVQEVNREYNFPPIPAGSRLPIGLQQPAIPYPETYRQLIPPSGIKIQFCTY